MLTYPLDATARPGPLLAFLPAPDPQAIAAHAVAFANTDGGALIVGLAPDGSYTGPVDGAALVRALAAATDACRPPIPLDRYEVVATPGGPALAVRVPRGKGVHALADGRVIVRAGARLRALSGDEIRALVAARDNGDFEAEVIPGARSSDLDPGLLADFMLRRADRLGITWREDSDRLLQAMGAVTPGHGVTVAGMLLLGRDPARWLPDSGARLVRFVGPAPAEDAPVPPAIDRALDGPLPRLVDALTGAVEAQLRRHVFDGDPERRAYPPAVVRELLVNALCHRDYRLRGARVTVRLSPDRLEIVSPGGLPGYMTNAGHLLDGRYSRNPRLSAALTHWGQKPGLDGGLVKALEILADAGHPPAEIEAGPYAITVRLFTARTEPAAAAPDTRGLSAHQRAILAHVREHGSVTLHEAGAICAGARTDALQRALSDLVAQGVLRRAGSRMQPYYILE